jgi:hypothetical protein
MDAAMIERLAAQLSTPSAGATYTFTMREIHVFADAVIRNAQDGIIKELATAKHNLKGAEAMCEMQMSLNRKLQARLEAEVG